MYILSYSIRIMLVSARYTLIISAACTAVTAADGRTHRAPIQTRGAVFFMKQQTIDKNDLALPDAVKESFEGVRC